MALSLGSVWRRQHAATARGASTLDLDEHPTIAPKWHSEPPHPSAEEPTKRLLACPHKRAPTTPPTFSPLTGVDFFFWRVLSTYTVGIRPHRKTNYPATVVTFVPGKFFIEEKKFIYTQAPFFFLHSFLSSLFPLRLFGIDFDQKNLTAIRGRLWILQKKQMASQ